MSGMEEDNLMMKSKPFSGKLILNIHKINRDDEKNTDGSEKEITYGEYVEKINKRALEEQKKIMQARMRGELKKADADDQ